MMFNTSCYTVVQVSKNWTDAKVRYESVPGFVCNSFKLLYFVPCGNVCSL